MTRTRTMTRKPRDLRACAAATMLGMLGMLGLTACNQLEKLDDSGGASGGDAVPTDVQLAFEGSCAAATACHAAGGIAPALDGASIASQIGAPSAAGIPYITLGDTANSYVAIKMLPQDIVDGLGATRTGARMPLGFDYASGNEDVLADTRTILAWIGGADYPGGGGVEETGDPTGDPTGDTDPTGGMPEPTFATVVSEVFPICSCHNADPLDGLNGNFSMKAGMEYASIVDVKSGQLATMDYIKPGEPEASYLYLKVIDKHLDAGGSGDAMPPGGMLAADKAMLLEEWIAAGALNN